jgi:hypothetical protein
MIPENLTWVSVGGNPQKTQSKAADESLTHCCMHTFDYSRGLVRFSLLIDRVRSHQTTLGSLRKASMLLITSLHFTLGLGQLLRLPEP